MPDSKFSRLLELTELTPQLHIHLSKTSPMIFIFGESWSFWMYIIHVFEQLHLQSWGTTTFQITRANTHHFLIEFRQLVLNKPQITDYLAWTNSTEVSWGTNELKLGDKRFPINKTRALSERTTTVKFPLSQFVTTQCGSYLMLVLTASYRMFLRYESWYNLRGDQVTLVTNH